MTTRLSVLLLCDERRQHANTVLDHVRAFTRWSRHDVRTFNPVGLPDSRHLDLEQFDVVVIHYSVFVISDHYLSEAFRRKLRAFRGLKVQFIQDEYRWVNRISATMRDLGIGVLFTCIQPSSRSKIWSDERLPGVRKVPTLTGYVPDELTARTSAPENRRLDIGYRGRDVPWWLGELGQEKIRIGQGVMQRAAAHDLRCDIAWTEDRRIYGKRWVRFVADCRAVLGTESGASIADFDGSIETAVRRYLVDHPGAAFDEVHRNVLAPHEGNAPVVAISPRVFEAAALRTAQILFPGEYSAILEPETHYLPLARDFANFADVVARLRDLPALRAMIGRCHADLVASGRYSYREFIRGFDAVLDEMVPESRRAPGTSYARARREAAWRRLGARTVALTAPLPMAHFRASLALALALRTREARRLLEAYLAHPAARRRAPMLPFLLDLLRLGLLVRAARTRAASFRVSAQLDAHDGRLVFVSLPNDGSAPPSLAGDEAAARELRRLIREGGLRVVEWDHTAVGARLTCGRPPFTFTVPVGSEGRHRFAALEALLRELPDRAGALLEAVGAPALAREVVTPGYLTART